MEKSTGRILVVAAFALILSSSVPAVTVQVHEDCRVLTLLWRFARLYGTVDLPGIETQKDVICAEPMKKGTLSWSNKKTMRTTLGTWSYPNGETARTNLGTWTYPNGEPAKSNLGTWTYPNGRTAHSGSSWRYPDGNSATLEALRAWARRRLPAAEFERLSEGIGAATTDEEVLSVMELAWHAR